MNRSWRVWLTLMCTVGSSSSTAFAASLTIGPGETHVLTADLVLGPADTLDAVGTADSPCQIVGGGFQIKTSAELTTGHVNIRHCTLTEVGAANKPALDLTFAADTDFTMSDTIVDASGMIHVVSNERATVLFRRNTLKDNTRASVIMGSIDDSEPAFRAEGFSPGQKVFQGNKVLKSWADWNNASNWTIGTTPGGSSAVDGNFFVGVRGGVLISGSRFIEVRGNYLRAIEPKLGWNQVATFAVGDSDNILVENNLIRGGNWIVREFGGGELRYNLMGDGHAVSWVIARTDGQANIHHNVFFHTEKLMPKGSDERVDGIKIIDVGEPSVQVYNNTLDGSNCYDPLGSGITVQSESLLKSLRNNAIFAIATDLGSATAMVGLGRDENGQLVQKLSPLPARMQYADYNLFNNRYSRLIDNYAVGVAGKTERLDDGFGLHDIPVGGAVDEQADANLTGPLPRVFPFTDEAIIGGTVTVCQILALYRNLYSPAAGSPLVDAGDPADGVGVDIGAIGVGAAHADDRFGLLCPVEDSVPPPLPAKAATCPEPVRLDPAGGRDGGIGPGVTPGREVRCVCEVGAGAPSWFDGAGLLLVMGALLRARRPAVARGARWTLWRRA